LAHRALHSFPTRRSSDLKRSVKSVFEALAESFSAVFPGVWGELVLVLIGGGAFTTGLVGLLLGGRRLPPFEIPPRLRPYANFALDRKSTRLNSSHVKISY